MKVRKLLALGLASIIGASLIAGCSGYPDDAVTYTPEKSEGSVYAFIAKDMQNPYMQKVYEGFEKACSETGSTAVYKGPSVPSSSKQIDIIEHLIAEGVDGIAIAANDADALQPALTAAMEAGIKVVSLDSAVNKDSRQVHIQQADPEQIAKSLVQSAYEMVNGNGGIAILSATEQATNQNLWIDCMLREINENKEKYANTPIVKIVYGDDDPTKSASETQALLLNPSVDVIIAPTTVGILAAAQVLQNKRSSVQLTGLGLPSDMAPYIIDGTCKWMYLWNPIDIGYLAAYAMDALAKGDITGAVNETFTAGELGEKSITADAEGGTEITLGAPFKFDYSNISEWRNIY